MPDEGGDEGLEACADSGGRPGVSGGFWYTWWRGDPLPELAPLTDFACDLMADPAEIADETGIAVEEAAARLAAIHRCYLSRLGGEAAGHGWSATTGAAIGELGIAIALPTGNHYLWGFETRPAWRGRGIYTHLLQALLRRESREAVRIWIGHEPGNFVSERGILRAGFQRVGELWVLADGAMELRTEAEAERAAAGAAILGVRLAR